MFEEDDDLPPGFSVVSLGGASSPAPPPKTRQPDDLPAGFQVVSMASTLPPDQRARPEPASPIESLTGYDPLARLRERFPTLKVTNSFRTDADDARLISQGYKPAKNSHHKRGDAIDIVAAGVPMEALYEAAREIFGSDAEVLNEGHHVHAALPGWGNAPGSPGLPDGFSVVEPDDAKVGSAPEVEEQAPLVSSATYGRAFFDEIPDDGVASQLSPEQYADYLTLARDPNSTAEQLDAFFQERGWDLKPGRAQEIIEARKAGAGVNQEVVYKRLEPKSLGDGATGAAVRGIADPLNWLDEAGGVVDTLGLTGGRENIWNSDRSFTDVWNSNIDVNRSILEADERDHPEARFLGQLASSMALPFGVGARTAGQLGKWGAIEGGIAGLGAGEGGLIDRAPNAAAGTALGAVGGYSIGRVIDDVGPLIRGNRTAPQGYRDGAYEAAPLVEDSIQAAGPTPAARNQPQGGVVGNQGGAAPAMDGGQTPSVINAPATQAGDLWRLDTNDLEALLKDKSKSDKEKLIDAFGEQGAKEFEALDRMQNSSNPSRADEGARLFEERFGNLTPEQERAAYGIGETDAQTDDIRAVLDAHGDVLPDDDLDWSSYMAAVAARRVRPEEFAAVLRGEGSADAQAAFVRMGKAYENLKAAGVPTDQIPRHMIDALVSRGGWDVGDAQEVIGGFAREMAAMSGARAPSRTALGYAGERQAAMDSGLEAPTLTGPPSRVVDRIDVNAPDDLPPGFRVVGQEDIGPLTARAPFTPEDVLPRQPLKAPNPYSELTSRNIPVKGKPGSYWQHKGPIDAEAFLRRSGGLRDSGGELAHMGMTNAPRSVARGEARLGRLIDNENGMDLDEAGLKLWEAGYFPNHPERPTVDDVLDMLAASRNGTRAFHPDDLDEVSRFEAAINDANRINEAEQEGRPLYDLTPPESAYDDAPELARRVGNLNLERVDKPEEVARLVQHIRNNVPEISEARGATVTNEELKQLARDLNVTPERILKWRRGSLPSPAEVFASRVIVHQGRQKIKELAHRVRGASDEELAKFHNVVMKQAALERQLAGMAADAGRLLQQFNAVAAAGDMSESAIKAYLRGVGGRESVEDVADKLIDMVENPKATGEFIAKLPKVRKRDMVNEYWINALLSGVPTHLVNFGGNGLVAMLTLPEEALIAAVGKLTRGADRARLREVGARAWGMMQGAREGLHLARIAFRTGEPSDAVSKVEARNYSAIPGKIGHFVRTPTRALTAADEFWASMHKRGAINAAAMRRALNGGGSHAEKMQRFAELRDNPDAEMLKYAASEALYRTFRKPLGKGGRSVQNFSNDFPGAKLIVPFVRTPINILKYAGERSPLSPVALNPFLAEIKAGGVRRDAVLGKLAMGAGLSAWAIEAAMDGRVSGGGPSDYKEASALRNSGWQPYSIKIGDKWVSYQRFEPLSLIIGATADFAELGKWATNKEADEIALRITTAIAKNITSKTWTSGLSDFFEVLSDPDRYGKRWVSRMAGSMAVPAVIGNAARAVDPEMREVNSALDAIKNRIPFLSHDLNVRRDVWGDPLKRGNLAGSGPVGGFYNYISPITFNTASKDPVKREVARLQAPLSLPGRSLRVAGANTRLTPEQYSYYVQLSGQPAKAYLAEFIKSPEWRVMTDDEKRDYLRETMAEFREIARGELRAMYPELAADGGALPAGFEVVQ